MPANVVVAQKVPADWPTPIIAAPDAKAEIQAVRFSTVDVKLGTYWSGDIVASSNTASVEITTNLFDFSVPRPKIGNFAFQFHVIDAPAFFLRGYPLRIIARNTAGEQTEEDVPFRISGRDTTQP